MSAVRPGLGRGLGSPYGEKILTLSSGVFFSTFLSPSGFPRMGNADKLSLLSDGSPQPLTFLFQGLLSPNLACPVAFHPWGHNSPSPPPSQWMEVGVTHHSGVCLPLVWQTLAPLPSWPLGTGQGTSIRELLSRKPTLPWLSSQSRELQKRISGLEGALEEVSSQPPAYCTDLL